MCGSDGKTYKDECSLLMARCMGHPDLEVMYHGECRSKFILPWKLSCFVLKHSNSVALMPFIFFISPESCSSVVCPGTHTCVTDQTNSAHCVMCRTAPCPIPMPSEHRICGNDNVTYPSACHLRRATCFLGRSIGVRHYGHCNSKIAQTPASFYFLPVFTLL